MSRTPRRALKRVGKIADRMRALCSTIRIHSPKSERTVSVQMVEKWAAEIEAEIKNAAEE